MTTIKPIYTAMATVTGGRNGHVRSSDGVLELDLRMPRELGGSGGPFSNPEQLFAAGYAACFDSALNRIIRQEGLQAKDTAVRAHVSIGSNDAGGFGLSVKLEINIPDLEGAVAEGLVQKAHQICPYSNATRGNITVDLVTTTVAPGVFAD